MFFRRFLPPFSIQNLDMTRRDAFTRKSGLMSETAEVPWDIQIQGRASGLWRRIKSQRNTLAGKAFTKPVVKGTTRQAIGHHMAALGMPQDGGYSEAEWKALTKDKLAEARTARLTHMVAEAKKDGPQQVANLALPARSPWPSPSTSAQRGWYTGPHWPVLWPGPRPPRS